MGLCIMVVEYMRKRSFHRCKQSIILTGSTHVCKKCASQKAICNRVTDARCFQQFHVLHVHERVA